VLRDEGLFRVHHVNEVRRAHGGSRDAAAEDRAWLEGCILAFIDEALDEPPDPATAACMNDHRITDRDDAGSGSGRRTPVLLPLHRPREPDVERDLSAHRL
jgi:hypothetical protein